jgi:hypothetical protein
LLPPTSASSRLDGKRIERVDRGSDLLGGIALSERGYWLSRIGSVCAIVGALGAAVGNILHPITPRDDPVGVARVIAESDAWTLIHVVIIFGLILMFLGLVVTCGGPLRDKCGTRTERIGAPAPGRPSDLRFSW